MCGELDCRADDFTAENASLRIDLWLAGLAFLVEGLSGSRDRYDEWHGPSPRRALRMIRPAQISSACPSYWLLAHSLRLARSPPHPLLSGGHCTPLCVLTTAASPDIYQHFRNLYNVCGLPCVDLALGVSCSPYEICTPTARRATSDASRSGPAVAADRIVTRA